MLAYSELASLKGAAFGNDKGECITAAVVLSILQDLCQEAAWPSMETQVT